MCGIAGFVGEFSRSEENLSLMLASLQHRGPDDQQTFFDKPFCGGMRRLSINDLEGGAQPLFNENKDIVTLYNGEIYNYGSLRSLLEGKNFRFKTSSDGEVIPFLYELYGKEAFSYLDGMFSISIWDTRTKELIIARDFPGEKPLYYSQTDLGFVFSSEVKALELTLDNLSLDRQALWDFPSFLWIPEPATAYKEIKSLKRGTFMTINQSGLIETSSFYPKNYERTFAISNLDQAISTTREVVENSITSRLLSDVPVGSFLSGGLDSSIVATVASRELSSLDTFTIEFEDLDDPYHGKANESLAARETSKFIGSNHHNVPVTAQDFRSSLKDFVKYGDLPFSVSSGLGIMAISKAARNKGIKVLLTGDGADECFGGYSWYKNLLSKKVYAKINDLDEDITFQSIGLNESKRTAVLQNMSPAKRAFAWHYYATELDKDLFFDNSFKQDLNSSIRFFSNLDESGKDKPMEFIKHDRNFYFPNEMLRKVDRFGMANSVEGRTPFASAEVISLSNYLKEEHVFKDNHLKWLLRKAFEDLLSSDVFNRPKHGFNVPIDHWLKTEWFDLVEETFSPGSEIIKNNIVKRDSMDKAVKLLKDTNRLHGHTIFSFIILNMWLGRRVGNNS